MELEFDIVDGNRSDADDTQVFQAGNDQTAREALRDSSPWCEIAPSAEGVLALLQRQDAMQDATQKALDCTPWEHLSHRPGNHEFVIGTQIRIYRKP